MSEGGFLARWNRKRLRWVARLPMVLYRAGLGWVLGGRFLLLTHRGRRTGQARQAVLEVVGRYRDLGWIVASGWGPKADWYQNLLACPQAEIQVGRNRLAVLARPLEADEARRVLSDYCRRNPRAARALTRALLGPGITDAELPRRMARGLPTVALTPLASDATDYGLPLVLPTG